eukprot:gene11100-3166_t
MGNLVVLSVFCLLVLVSTGAVATRPGPDGKCPPDGEEYKRLTSCCERDRNTNKCICKITLRC